MPRQSSPNGNEEQPEVTSLTTRQFLYTRPVPGGASQSPTRHETPKGKKGKKNGMEAKNKIKSGVRQHKGQETSSRNCGISDN